RPTLLVVVSALVFMAALLVAIWGFSVRASARRAYVRELGEQADVERLNVEWERLTQQERESGGDAGASKPRELIYSRMQELARRAGMKESSMTPRANPTTRGQYTVTEYVYQDIKDPELKALM